LARLMGGTISVESTYDLGSIFTLTLPQRYNNADDFQEWTEEELATEGSSILLTGRARIDTTAAPVKRFLAPEAKILIVDDVPTNLMVAKGLLAPYEAQVDICLSGREAIKHVQQKDYDIVFMDHMMPEMDGLETVEHIRSLENGRFASLSIVALSANAIVGAKEMFLQNGFDDFLSKPIDTEKLNSMLLKWLPKEKQQKGEATKPESNTPSSELQIDGVDTARGIKLSGSSLDVYKSVLEMFYQDGEAKLNQLAKCVQDNDLSLYTTYVHALKSACANIGATTVSEQAAELEAAGIKKDMDFITSNNPSLMQNLENLLASISQVMDFKAPAPSSGDLDKEALKSVLANLKSALASFNPSAVDEASASLADFANYEEVKAPIKELQDTVFVGMYPKASTQIDSLLDYLT